MKTARINMGRCAVIRSLLKVLLIVIVLVGLAAFLLGRWSSSAKVAPESTVSAWGPADTNRAREGGAKIGEAAGNAANRVQQAIEPATITAKIKSKMALDDLTKARNIDVDTNGTVVTLTGVVGSEAERKRAVELAKETERVTSVIDHLRVR